MDFKSTRSGIMVPNERCELNAQVNPDAGFTVIEDWTYSKCDERRHVTDPIAIRRALEFIYIKIDPGYGGSSLANSNQSEKDRLTKSLNEISVGLLGGIPNGFEEFT